MELTDVERAEFIELSEATYDPGLWDEADLPILRKNKLDYEEELARERTAGTSLEDPALVEEEDDDEADCGKSGCPE